MKHKRAFDEQMSFIATMSYNLQLLFILNRTIPFIIDLDFRNFINRSRYQFYPSDEKDIYALRKTR